MNLPPLDDWLSEWSAIWGVRNLADRVQIAPGPRLRRSLGRCHPTNGRIRIHRVLYEPEHHELLREVVCHETAHAAVYLLHGRGVRPHGAEWQRLVAAAGYAPTTKMDPRRLPEALRTTTQPKTLYRHSCPACGTMRVARRRVHNWRCRACHDAGLEGKLQIVSVSRR